MKAIGKRAECVIRLALMAIFFTWPSSASLDPQTSIARYDHEIWRQTPQGISINTTTLIQTLDGYLWLGAENGLVRFDGMRFTVFDSSNTPQLKGDSIDALLEDKHVNLWIGTDGGGICRGSKGAGEISPRVLRQGRTAVALVVGFSFRIPLGPF
jgi:ligand-binding sensor domain-containing protein